ncbi:hypothetical protein [Bordetella genomosp. 11]|nr:hypothetical protein [Bordetella genomosp. 11]
MKPCLDWWRYPPASKSSHMPPITGANPAPITLVASSDSIQPSHRAAGTGFKAIQGLTKRIRPWQSATRSTGHAPFTLVRGEFATRTDRAARCRERIADVGALLHGGSPRPLDTDELATLQRSEEKLRGQTRIHCSMRDLMVERAIRAHLPQADARQARRRYKGLIKLRQAVSKAPQGAGPAHDAVRATLQAATALEASAAQVQAIGDAYRSDPGRIVPSARFVQDLIGLLDGMNMLRGHDQDPADFLYPAVKLMHEANRVAHPDAGRVLGNLLRDLGEAGRDDPEGLRAQLKRNRGALDLWLANNSPDSLARDRAAARQGLADQLDVLLDGLAGAARKVLHEELRGQVPGWAREAQRGLFREAGILHASAQRWREREPGQNTGEAILRASPPDAVKMLLEQAANQALGIAAKPAGNLGPLLGQLKSGLDQVAQHIQQALDERQFALHAPAAEIAALRQALMQAVLEETGILGEIHRLNASADAVSTPTTRKSATRDTRPPRTPFTLSGPVDKPLNPTVAKRMKKVEAEARRQVAKLLSACRQAGGKPLPAYRLQALNDIHAALYAVHGESARTVWQRVLTAEARRLKDHDLLALNTGALHAHVSGMASLAAKVADPAHRAASDKLLRDVWTAVRAASASRDAGPVLKAWCATLATPRDMAEGATLPRQVESLRDRIGMLADGTVPVQTLLDAALQSLDNAELKALIHALATVPALAAVPAAAGPAPAGISGVAATLPGQPASPAGAGTLTLRQRLTRYLRGDSARIDANTVVPSSRRIDTRAFLDQLYEAAKGHAEQRMEALRDASITAVRSAVFEQAAFLHTLLDTPQAAAANGPLLGTLERLIADAARHGRLTHEYGERVATEMMGTGFLRTVHGYDVAQDVTRALSRDIAALHMRLQASMDDIGIARFRSSAALGAWRAGAVDYILQETGIWKHLDQLAHRQPRDAATQPDWVAARPSDPFDTPRRGGTRASTKSTRSVDENCYKLPTSLLDRPRRATAVAIDEEEYSLIQDWPRPDSIYAVIPALEPAPTAVGGHGGGRASVTVSEDSGIGDCAKVVIDSHRREPATEPASPVKPLPSSPAARLPKAPDPGLVAALRAALEQRHRGEWNRA